MKTKRNIVIKKSAILTPEECKERQGFRLLWSTKWDPNKQSELDNLDSENSTDSEFNQQDDKDNQNIY